MKDWKITLFGFLLLILFLIIGFIASCAPIEKTNKYFIVEFENEIYPK